MNSFEITDQGSNPGNELRDGSISLLRDIIATDNSSYLGYPTERLTFANGAGFNTELGHFYLPDSNWFVAAMQPGYEAGISMEDMERTSSLGLAFDQYHRPVHPWINSLLSDEVGVYTGKGFYRQWGPNYTADPIIMRTDTVEPMTLLIRRNDTHRWALAGGFVDPNEQGQDAAMREAMEETLLPLNHFDPKIRHVYTGPVADVRMTANAWPETQAYVVSLDPNLTFNCLWHDLRGDPEEVEECMWFTESEANQALAGSHKLLVNLGFEYLSRPY